MAAAQVGRQLRKMAGRKKKVADLRALDPASAVCAENVTLNLKIYVDGFEF